MSKVALQSSEGKYVTAEQGGGLAYGTTIYNQRPYVGTAPLYANRDVIGDWETFELIKNDDGSVSFKTANGFYITASEGGGFGVATNRTEKGDWECFWLGTGGIQTWNQVNYLTVEQGADKHINATRIDMFAWQMFTVIDLDPIPTYTQDQLRNWNGNLCGLVVDGLRYGPRVVDGIVQSAENWDDGKWGGVPTTRMLFTPGYVAENDEGRKLIRAAYKKAKHTHFALNLTNHSTLYRNAYPNWDDSLIDTYLTELLKDKLITVGYSMGDQDKVIDCKADAKLVNIALGQWEPSTPIARPALDNDNQFWLIHQRFPDSLIYWHCPPYQGAPFVEYAEWGLPEGDAGINAMVWRYMVQESFVHGFMFQGKAWEHDCMDSINCLNSFVERLGEGVNGWPHPVDIVDYEETAYYLFNMSGSVSEALDMTEKIRETYGSDLIGYGNG